MIRNPWAKATFNLTQQMAITKRDPALANSLRADALREAAASPKPKRTFRPVPREKTPVVTAEMRELDRIRSEHAARAKAAQIP